jgi:hypothetical protein
MSIELMEDICDKLVEGHSMRQIAKMKGYPSDDTVFRYVQKNEEAYDMYIRAKAIQGERIQDQIDEIMNNPLPTDPKHMMADVQMRRLKVDTLQKRQTQLQPKGIRNKTEDVAGQNIQGTITLSWEKGDVEVKSD